MVFDGLTRRKHVYVSHSFMPGSQHGTDSSIRFSGSDIDFEDDNISPEISLTYSINDDITIYGAYKTDSNLGE